MAIKRANYPYAIINDNNIVYSVSMEYSRPTEDNPFYMYFIPIIDYDITLLGQRYIGRDSEGYGLFEPVPEPEKQTETVTE